MIPLILLITFIIFLFFRADYKAIQEKSQWSHTTAALVSISVESGERDLSEQSEGSDRIELCYWVKLVYQGIDVKSVYAEEILPHSQDESKERERARSLTLNAEKIVYYGPQNHQKTAFEIPSAEDRWISVAVGIFFVLFFAGAIIGGANRPHSHNFGD